MGGHSPEQKVPGSTEQQAARPGAACEGLSGGTSQGSCGFHSGGTSRTGPQDPGFNSLLLPS